MLPFGVTIPATVPQRSEIPVGLMNYPVFPVKTDAVLREEITGVHCIVRDLHFYPRVTTKNTASMELAEIYQRLGEISLSYPADGGGRFIRNAAKFYTRLRGSTSNKHRYYSNYTSIYYLLPGRLNIIPIVIKVLYLPTDTLYEFYKH